MNRRIPNLSRVFQAGAYGRPNVVAWTPSDWADLSAHYSRTFGLYKDAGTTPATSAADAIYRWVAVNGGGSIYLDQPGSTLRPVLTSDGGALKPLFDGSDDYMSGTLSALQTSTFAIGFRYAAAGGSAYKILGCLGVTAIGTGQLVWLGQHSDNKIGGSNNSFSTDLKGGTNDTSKHTLIACRTPTTFEVFLDNASLGSVSTSGTANSGILVGCYKDTNLFANAYISDVVIGSAVIGSSDRASLHSYMYARA